MHVFTALSASTRRTLAGAIIFLILNALGAWEVSSAKLASPEATRAAIATVLEDDKTLSLPVERVRDILKIHYLQSEGALLWAGSAKMQQLIDRFANAEADGLKTEDYPAEYLEQLRAAADLSHPEHAAFTELMFSAFFLAYAADLKVGRFVPAKIDPELFLERRTVDGPKTLALLADHTDLVDFFTGWEPRRREYRALRALLERYRRIEAAGDWPSIEPGEVLKPGMRGARVAQIRSRLVASGDLTATGSDPVEYDDALVMAVKEFQKRHGLEPDGVVGSQSLLALNIPVEDRIRQIIVNMERWRWMPEDLGTDYVKVNIAGFELSRVQNERNVRRMNVVVGKIYHRTPVFSDRIRFVEFNPTWTVPYSIATKEMLPDLRKDPAHYAAKGFDLLKGSETPIPWQSVDWSQVSADGFPFVIRQQPGPTNALGRVKFMFPNRHNVYLHDTPARGLFAQSFRALSHGCVRLSEPIEFAVEVLAGTPDWSRNRIDQVLASQETTRADLRTPLPVHLVYETAWVAEDGAVHFRPDIYGRDKRLFRAIFAKFTT